MINTKTKIGIIGLGIMLLFIGMSNAQSINPLNVSSIFNAPQAVNSGTPASSVFNPYANYFIWFGDSGFNTEVGFGAWSNCPYVQNITNTECLVATSNGRNATFAGDNAINNSNWNLNSPFQTAGNVGSVYVPNATLNYYPNSNTTQIANIAMINASFDVITTSDSISFTATNQTGLYVANPNYNVGVDYNGGAEDTFGGYLQFSGVPSNSTLEGGILYQWTYTSQARYNATPSRYPDAVFNPSNGMYLTLTQIAILSPTPASNSTLVSMANVIPYLYDSNLYELQALNTNTQNSLTTLQAQLNSSNATIVDLNQTIADLSAYLSSQNTTISGMNNSIASFNASLSAIQTNTNNSINSINTSLNVGLNTMNSNTNLFAGEIANTAQLSNQTASLLSSYINNTNGELSQVATDLGNLNSTATNINNTHNTYELLLFIGEVALMVVVAYLVLFKRKKDKKPSIEQEIVKEIAKETKKENELNKKEISQASRFEALKKKKTEIQKDEVALAMENDAELTKLKEDYLSVREGAIKNKIPPQSLPEFMAYRNYTKKKYEVNIEV